jgi:hypothetical protein
MGVYSQLLDLEAFEGGGEDFGVKFCLRHVLFFDRPGLYVNVFYTF